MEKMQPVEIGLILYPGVQQAAVLGITDLFGVANRIATTLLQQSELPLKVSHWQVPSPGESPICIAATGAPRASVLNAIILLPTLDDPTVRDTANELSVWLRDRHADGVILGSCCAGAFLLANTGLLAGRRITTHWVYAELLQRLHPDVQVDADQLIIDNGDVITAGGFMSWTDLGLRLVDRFLGPITMIETARMLLVDPPGREQRYYSPFLPRMTHGDMAVLKVQHWLRDTQAKNVALASMADKAGLEQRTFLRRFQRATGMTSTEYYQRLRISRARELLQFSDLPIDHVAWEVGYSDSSSFRKVFIRIVGLPPGEYRRRFSPK